MPPEDDTNGPEDPKKALQDEIDRLTTEFAIEKAKKAAELEAVKSQQELEKYLANKELELLKSQKDTITSLLPTSTKEGLEGTITTGDKFGYLAEQVAYAALDAISTDICTNVKTALGKTAPAGKDSNILIINDLNIAQGDLPYFELLSQCTFFASITTDLFARVGEHKKLVEEGEEGKPVRLAMAGIPLLLAALSAAPGVAGSLSSLASFFKTDYSIQGRDVAMTDTALISAVAGKLSSDLNRKVFILNAYPLDEKDLTSKVMKKMLDLYTLSYRITEETTALSEISIKETEKIAQFTKDLNELERKKNKDDSELFKEIAGKKSAIKKGQAWLQKAAVLIKEANALNTDLLNFMRGFTTAESGKNFSKFVLAVLSEKIRDENRLNVKYLLYLHIESKGGEAITYKKPFWKPTGDTAFLGGIIVTYVLLGETGEILASETIRNVHSLKYNLDVTGEAGMIYPLPLISAPKAPEVNPLDLPLISVQDPEKADQGSKKENPAN